MPFHGAAGGRGELPTKPDGTAPERGERPISGFAHDEFEITNQAFALSWKRTAFSRATSGTTGRGFSRCGKF